MLVQGVGNVLRQEVVNDHVLRAAFCESFFQRG